MAPDPITKVADFGLQPAWFSMASLSPATKLWTADPAASLASVARHLDIYGSMQATTTNLSTGVFLTAYALALGATPLSIALLASVPLAARVSQFFTSAHIERAGHWPRTALISAAAARVLCWRPRSFRWSSSTARSQHVPLSWPLRCRRLRHRSSIWRCSRGWRSWFRRRCAAGFSARATGSAVSSARCRRSSRRSCCSNSPETRHDRASSSPSCLQPPDCSAWPALPVLARVPPPRRSQSRVEVPRMREVLTAPVRDDNFRVFLSFAVVWHVALGMSAPFLIVFMLRDLRLSLFAVTALSALTSIVGAATMQHWGRLGDHFGSKTWCAPAPI